MLHGNWVDFLIIIFVFLSGWEAWGRGFFIGFFDLIGFALSFLVALKYYSIASYFLVGNFSFPKGIADAVGFFLTAFIAEVLFSYILSYVVTFLPTRVTGSRINRSLGFIPSICIALITISFVLTITLSLPIRGSIKKSINDSKFGGYLISKTHYFERTLGRIFNSATLETLNFLTITPDPASTERVNLHFTQEAHVIDKVSEHEMLLLVNNERKSNGLEPLEVDEKLRGIAREFGADMLEKGYFSHYSMDNKSPFDRMSEVNIIYIIAGENIAFAPTGSIAHRGLMESKGHRENILSTEFGKIGIGVVDGGIYGKMFVQEFTD